MQLKRPLQIQFYDFSCWFLSNFSLVNNEGKFSLYLKEKAFGSILWYSRIQMFSDVSMAIGSVFGMFMILTKHLMLFK